MATRKITQLTEDTSPAADDWLLTVDVSDTTMGSDGTNKKVKVSNLPSSGGGGADKWRVYGSSNVGHTGAPRFIGLRGNYVDTSSLQIYGQAMMPENCELIKLTIQVGVTTTARVVVNKNGGTSVYTTGNASFTAGTPQTFTPTGTSISQGELVNISVEVGGTNPAPGDVHLVMTFQET